MKKSLFLLPLFVLLSSCVNAQTITGQIDKQIIAERNKIVDAETKYPIPHALVKIPAINYSEYTDEGGHFNLEADINSPMILSVEKQGYKPFSMTVSDSSTTITAEVSKSSPFDIVVDTEMIHLGDNSFSKTSANAGDFSLMSSGAFYSKNFKIKRLCSGQNLNLIIGSIIGIDTPQAQKLGQSHVVTAYSSAPEIYFNNNKIAEIKVNGDNQKISVPVELVNFEADNNITIKSGKNMYKKSAVDYDDIEFVNIMLEILPRI